MILANVGCGTHKAPKPWVNLDTVRHNQAEHGEIIDPDIVVEPGAPLPFDDGACSRVLLSHVLEHIPWEDVPAFLVEVRRVLDGALLVVGPDLHKTIKAYRAGHVHWDLVTSVMEHKDWPPDMAAWPGAPHHWNCHEVRVRAALQRSGFDVETSAPSASLLREWPLVGWTPSWQCAVSAQSVT